MHHFFEAITNTAGQSLIGYFARVINPTTQMQVTLASDDAGTPIQVISGVANMAKTDEFGNLSLYVAPGTYNLDIYGPDATSFLYRVPNVAMNSSKGDQGDPGPAGPQGEGLAEVMAPTGSSFVGFQQVGSGAAVRTALDKAREQPITPDDFAGTDTQKVQAALSQSGLIYLTRSYSITSTLTMRGNTQLVGKPGAKLVWSGSGVGNILQDSSAVVPDDVNLNILLENFEIVGGSLVTGDAFQVGINFYRTGNVTIRNVSVHGLGGSGIRWGNSMADTVDVLVENCRVYDLRHGDAIQGVGRNIVVRNNVIGVEGSTSANFGDTGIALLYDFSALTNPSQLYSSNVEISSNTIIGNYNDSGVYVGNGQQIQTGIALGPFKVGVAVNTRIINNVVSRCYLNLWAIVMDDLLVAQNKFGPHAATATGNIRFDGVTGLQVQNNKIALKYASTGVDYSGILLVAQRNVYGASVFDADIDRVSVTANEISATTAVQGVRVTFEQANTSPVYISKITNAKFEANTFTGVSMPFAFAPQTGTNNNTAIDVVISRNKMDGAATAMASFGGGGLQYRDVRLFDNPAPLSTAPMAGSGVSAIVLQHKVASLLAFPNATPTTVLSLPATGAGAVTIKANIPGVDSRYIAQATFVYNNGDVANVTGAFNGTNLTISRSTRDIQVNYDIGGNANVIVTATYS